MHSHCHCQSLLLLGHSPTHRHSHSHGHTHSHSPLLHLTLDPVLDPILDLIQGLVPRCRLHHHSCRHPLDTHPRYSLTRPIGLAQAHHFPRLSQQYHNHSCSHRSSHSTCYSHTHSHTYSSCHRRSRICNLRQSYSHIHSFQVSCHHGCHCWHSHSHS